MHFSFQNMTWFLSQGAIFPRWKQAWHQEHWPSSLLHSGTVSHQHMFHQIWILRRLTKNLSCCWHIHPNWINIAATKHVSFNFLRSVRVSRVETKKLGLIFQILSQNCWIYAMQWWTFSTAKPPYSICLARFLTVQQPDHLSTCARPGSNLFSWIKQAPFVPLVVFLSVCDSWNAWKLLANQNIHLWYSKNISESISIGRSF